MDDTLEFVQETPVKLQGEFVGSQSGSGFGLGSEDLKLKSWFESLEREEEAAEDAEEEQGFREREMMMMRRQKNLRLIEVPGVTVILLELREITTTSRLFLDFHFSFSSTIGDEREELALFLVSF
jgi:hypothetical protein